MSELENNVVEETLGKVDGARIGKDVGLIVVGLLALAKVVDLAKKPVCNLVDKVKEAASKAKTKKEATK